MATEIGLNTSLPQVLREKARELLDFSRRAEFGRKRSEIRQIGKKVYAATYLNFKGTLEEAGISLKEKYAKQALNFDVQDANNFKRIELTEEDNRLEVVMRHKAGRVETFTCAVLHPSGSFTYTRTQYAPDTQSGRLTLAESIRYSLDNEDVEKAKLDDIKEEMNVLRTVITSGLYGIDKNTLASTKRYHEIGTDAHNRFFHQRLREFGPTLDNKIPA